MIADDHPIARFGLQALLSRERDMDIVGEAADGVGAVALARSARPDVLVLDLSMPGLHGIGVIEDLATTAPEVRVLVLTGFEDDEHLLPALRAGASGYLLKGSEPYKLVEGIREVAAGRSPLDPAIARLALRGLTQPPPVPAADGLTEREKDVLALVARGLSNKAVAARLALSERTVRSHVTAVLAKLHLTSRTEAALYALRTGLVRLDEQDP